MRIHDLDHVVLNVADVHRSLAFYAEVLGLPVERLDDYEKGEAGFPSVRINDATIIDLFPPVLHGDGAGGRNTNHLCLVAAGNLASVQKELAARGVPIERGPVEVFGARGTGTSVYVRDPDGNTVELRTYEAR